MKVSDNWGIAYPDCKARYTFLLDNNHPLLKETTWKSAIVVVIGIVVTVLCCFWNMFPSNPKIAPEYFTLVLSGLALLVFIVFCIDFAIMSALMAKDRRMIIAYQAIWEDILDIVEENLDNDRLPAEPKKTAEIKREKEKLQTIYLLPEAEEIVEEEGNTMKLFKKEKKKQKVEAPEPVKEVEALMSNQEPETVDYTKINWDSIVAYLNKKSQEKT